MNETEKLLLMGLPETGKTTFLAAFWYLVDNNKTETSLILGELEGDREYLNGIREKWLTFTPLDRTRLVNEPVVSMKLININTENKKTIELHIPDLSGETYLNQWLKREWSLEYQNLIIGARGALLFIHPNKIYEPTRIDQANILIDEISADEEKSGVNNSFDKYVEWDPKNAPTQVQLVDLLQFIEDFPNITFPFKLSIMISAWDLIDSLGISPDDWLRTRLPLLHQYLSTNQHIFPYKVYGVSAQGWSYNSEEKALNCLEPADRIIVKCKDYNGNDLTKPVTWLMSENEL